ncbi:MAG: PP2C family protein-serine/threonine phosphatase [Candidatus Kryptonium sp.]|nr:PP2C family protein-serine/threonine phosphatase [Candidatus Kryptonium sp.]MDW8108833.1 PP2C family protein-serine/threonine phosphatase [Candidatus Kryptonium sp.]
MKKTEAVFTLDSVFNLGKTLSDLSDPEEILKVSILSLMGKLKINKVAGFILSSTAKFKLVYSSGVKVVNQLNLSCSSVPLNLTKLKTATIENFNHKLKSFVKSNGFNYIFPVRLAQVQKRQNEQIFGLIFIKTKRKNFTKSEIDYINFVLNLTAISLKNIFSLIELRKSIFNLTTLNEFIQSIFLKKSEEEIFTSFALILIGHFKVDNVIVARIENETMKIFSFPENKSFKLELIKKILRLESSSVLMKHPNFRLAIAKSPGDSTRNYVLLLGSKNHKNFEAEKIDLIKSFFTSFINAVENLRMLNFEYDIKLACEIQKKLLPSEIPKDKRVEIYALTIPSKIVGGDYYDVIKINRDEFIIVIADVCGKGLSSALLMSNLQASLKSILIFTNDVRKIVNLLNKVAIQNTPADEFITLFICKINLRNYTLEYVNAGHNPPFLLSDGKIKFLDEGGTVLGVFESKYKSEKVKVKPRDIIFLYTDGIVEITNKFGTEIGIDEIVKLVKAHQKSTANKIGNEINKFINAYAQRMEQPDDMTMVVVKFK